MEASQLLLSQLHTAYSARQQFPLSCWQLRRKKRILSIFLGFSLKTGQHKQAHLGGGTAANRFLQRATLTLSCTYVLNLSGWGRFMTTILWMTVLDHKICFNLLDPASGVSPFTILVWHNKPKPQQRNPLRLPIICT